MSRHSPLKLGRLHGGEQASITETNEYVESVPDPPRCRPSHRPPYRVGLRHFTAVLASKSIMQMCTRAMERMQVPGAAG